MSFADEATPRWVDEVKRTYGQASTKYACVGYVSHLPLSIGMKPLTQNCELDIVLVHRTSAMSWPRRPSAPVHSPTRPFWKIPIFQRSPVRLPLFNSLILKKWLKYINRASITLLFCGGSHIPSRSQTTRFRYPAVRPKVLPIPAFLWCWARICSARQYEKSLRACVITLRNICRIELESWYILGYVKEQSLKAIVEWFDFWLSQ